MTDHPRTTGRFVPVGRGHVELHASRPPAGARGLLADASPQMAEFYREVWHVLSGEPLPPGWDLWVAVPHYGSPLSRPIEAGELPQILR